MDTSAQDTGYYVWETAEKSFAVHVNLAVIDAVSAEIMRGFGAVPKRGAEVGGLLLGSVEHGDRTTVHIEDFEPVECGYTRGPSYLLSAEEQAAFEEAVESWRPDDGSRPRYTVGFFRSHTRDGLALAPEDIELMDRCFPGPASVALLVKPFATKPSVAGFFFRENGAFQTTTPMEFPFRRLELTGGPPPERRPLADRTPRRRDSRTLAAAGDDDGFATSQEADSPGTAYAITTPKQARLGAWMWIPLSFIFLLLGVGLGYLAGLNTAPRGLAGAGSDYALSLAVQKADGTLAVQWNGNSAAIRNAARGVLEVHDGGYAKTVDLDVSQLRGGKLAFHNASDTVSFHLTVYLNQRLSVSETLDWHQ